MLGVAPRQDGREADDDGVDGRSEAALDVVAAHKWSRTSVRSPQSSQREGEDARAQRQPAVSDPRARVDGLLELGVALGQPQAVLGRPFDAGEALEDLGAELGEEVREDGGRLELGAGEAGGKELRDGVENGASSCGKTCRQS